MNAKQQKTLDAIFIDPVKANIKWSDVESLLMSLGAEKKKVQGHGSVSAFMELILLSIALIPKKRPTKVL